MEFESPRVHKILTPEAEASGVFDFVGLVEIRKSEAGTREAGRRQINRFVLGNGRLENRVGRLREYL